VRSGGIYQSLGLQNGDALLRINEYNIFKSRERTPGIHCLEGMDRCRLIIIRDWYKDDADVPDSMMGGEMKTRAV